MVYATIALLAPVIGADAPLTLQPPSEVVLCQPVNLTWTGGTPPYRLDVEPFVDNSPKTTANQRKNGLEDTWFLWTPDFLPGSILQISIEGSGTASVASVRATELSSSNSSCLNATSATSSDPSSTLLGSSLSTSVDQPSATPSSAFLASSRSRLSKGAIAGIAVAAVVISIGLIALCGWYLPRRRSSEQHLAEKGYERTIASPSVPYSGAQPSSTLVSTFDPNKPDASTSPSVSALGRTSYTREDDDPFRPRPYLVARESTASGSSQGRAAGPGKKHARELSDPTSTSSAASISKVPMDASAPQLRPADAQAASNDVSGGGGGGDRDGDGHESEDVLRLDVGGASRPSRALRLGFEDRDMEASDFASNSGEATLPPPYSAIPGAREV